MSQLTINNCTISAEEKQVVSNASLTLKSGEIHVLMGPNGGGKSSFLNAIMGHPTYQITNGQIILDDEDITMLATEKKAHAGIFLSLQHLPAVAGVTLTNFLFRAQKSIKGGDITPLDFYTLMQSRANEFGIDPTLLRKHLNTGLSGGEKKLSEVLQLLALEPKFAFLDEIDSGVDVDALKKLFAVILHLKQRGVGFLLVTHHPEILPHITPDVVYVMKEGKLVATGGNELVAKISTNGFESIV